MRHKVEIGLSFVVIGILGMVGISAISAAAAQSSICDDPEVTCFDTVNVVTANFRFIEVEGISRNPDVTKYTMPFVPADEIQEFIVARCYSAFRKALSQPKRFTLAISCESFTSDSLSMCDLVEGESPTCRLIAK